MATRLVLASLCGLGAVCSGADTSPSSTVLADAAAFKKSLLEVMQPVVDETAELYNCSIAVAVRLQNGTRVAAIAGDKDLDAGTPAVLSDKYVWGSVTKTVTGTSILAAKEAGKLDLKDSIVPYVNPILKEMAAKDPTMKFDSLQDLFGDEVSKVTIEDLARMSSGIPDYDTAKPEGHPPSDAFRKSCYKDASRDYAPQDMLGVSWVAKKHLDFPPGRNQSYSSTNYVLLGLILAQLNNDTWKTYDQSMVMPPASHKDTSFAVTGSPSEYTQMHGYDRTSYNGNDPKSMPGIDVSDVHCVYAGWTASDYTASVQDAADWAYDVYGPDSPILSEADQEAMVPDIHTFYGFSTHNLDRKTGLEPYTEAGRAWGHLGATYGYDSIIVFFPKLNMSMAVASNIETTDQTQPSYAVCKMYNAVKAFLTYTIPLNCEYTSHSYYGGCKCKLAE